jgi:hypothetical protein
MPNLTSIGVTSGIPTTGTGTVSTIDALMAIFTSIAAGGLGGGLVKLLDGNGNPITSDVRGSERPLSVQILDASGNQIIPAGPVAPATVPAATQQFQGNPNIPIDQYNNYKTVAASQTTQLLGASGAVDDYLAGVLIVPATTSPGNVLIRDAAGGSDITIFTGGATSVGDLRPFMVPLGIMCLTVSSPGWRLTTGANVSAVAIGKFT